VHQFYTVVRLAPANDAWNCVSGGSFEIMSVFMFVDVVVGLSLPIYMVLVIGEGCCSRASVL
jgi:hypothetical protein